MNALHVDSIQKEFGTQSLLNDIHVACSIGEIVGLLGRNGSGKSTLLQIIFGSTSASNKFIRVGDKVISNLSNSSHLIKYLPQHPFLPRHIKIHKIIDLFCSNENTAALKQHELVEPLLYRKSSQLSGGERRLIEVLLILYSDAPFVLFDEPFNGVAPLYKAVIKEVIQMQTSRKGIILTDHDYNNVLDVATKVLLLHKGSIKAINSNDDLKQWDYLPTSNFKQD